MACESSERSNALLNYSFRPQYGSFRPQSSICSVEYNSRYGTGALIGLKFPENTWRTLFMTSYQVAPLRNSSDVTDLKITFEDVTIGNVSLTSSWVKILWTSPSDELDVTVIELSPTAMTMISRTNVARLLSAAPIDKGNVSVCQCLNSERSEIFIGSGSICNITGNIIEYSANIKAGSPGSPIVNEDFKIIGLESKGVIGSNKWQGIGINKIFEAYQNELQRVLYNNQTENEIWLIRINEIPQSDLKLIGSGGYGRVFKKLEGSGCANYSLKIVEGFGGLDNYTSQVRALENEYNLVRSLELHPRIIQFFALVKDENKARLIIIMEYLEGGSLQDKIKSYGHLNKVLSLKYLEQILEAVDFLHKREIYHSDIKPANILFTCKDDIKLCDFGIAVHIRTESSASESHAKGDFFYISPERLQQAPRSPGNDMWSIGATFVTMITGHSLNHNEHYPIIHISQFIIFIDSQPISEYLNSLCKNDYRREIISRTLCPLKNRAKSYELLEVCQKLGSEDSESEYLVTISEEYVKAFRDTCILYTVY